MQVFKRNRIWNALFTQGEESLFRLKWAFYGTLLFGLAAHGFAYFNMTPRHDQLNYLDHFADHWEVSLGRFVQVLWGETRGQYLMPWMNGMLVILFLSIASFLISEMLEHKGRWVIFTSAGLMAVNVSMLALHYNFLYCADAYAFAAMLACAGAFLLVRFSGWKARCGAIACLTMMMGIYQSYILVTVVLLMFFVIQNALQERKFLKNHIRQYLGWFAALLATAVLYFLLYQLMLRVWQIGNVDSYNSPAALTGMNVAELLPYVRHAYSSFAVYFLGFRQSLSLFHAANILLWILALLLIGVHAVRTRLPLINGLVTVGLLLLFPGLSQVMSILSRQLTTHFLTAYALFLMYPWLLTVLSQMHLDGKAIPNKMTFRTLGLILCGCVLFWGIRTANECYAYQKIEYDATLSHMTRIMDEIDRMPEYDVDETEIVIVGKLGNVVKGLKQPAECQWMHGKSSTVVTYTQAFRSMAHALGEPMNIRIDDQIAREYSAMEEVENMPGYPKPGYCQMIDGRIVLKLRANED